MIEIVEDNNNNNNIKSDSLDLSGSFEDVNLDDSIIENNNVPKRKLSIFQRATNRVGFTNVFKKNAKVYNEEDKPIEDKPIKKNYKSIFQTAAKVSDIIKYSTKQKIEEIDSTKKLELGVLSDVAPKKTMFQSFMGYLSPSNSPSLKKGKLKNQFSMFQSLLKSTDLVVYQSSLSSTKSNYDDNLIKTTSNGLNIDTNGNNNDHQTDLELLRISKLPLNNQKKKPYYYWIFIKNNIERINREDRNEKEEKRVEKIQFEKNKIEIELEQKEKEIENEIENEIEKEIEIEKFDAKNPVLTAERVWNHYTELKNVEKVEVIKKIDYLLSNYDTDDKENQIKYDEYIISILGENNNALKNILHKLESRKVELSNNLKMKKLKVLEDINKEGEILKQEKLNSIHLTIENKIIKKPYTALINKTPSSIIKRRLTSKINPISPLVKTQNIFPRPLSPQGKVLKFLASTSISLSKPLSPTLKIIKDDIISGNTIAGNIVVEDNKNDNAVEIPLVDISSPILRSPSPNQLDDLNNKPTLVFEDNSFYDDNINDNINDSFNDNNLKFCFDDFNNDYQIENQHSNIHEDEEQGEEDNEIIDPKSLRNSFDFYSEPPSPFDCPPIMKQIDNQIAYKKILYSPKLIKIPSRDERKSLENKELKNKKIKNLMVLIYILYKNYYELFYK